MLAAALGAAATGAQARAEISARPARPRPALLRPELRAVQADLGPGARLSWLAVEAATGRVIDAHLPLLPQPPASTLKALTAVHALNVLGPAHRLRTRLMRRGPIEDGVLAGDLILLGGGDPTLDTDALAALAETLAAGGLRRVAGQFVVVHGALPDLPMIDPAQKPEASYNPGISGLNLNFNRVHFGWRAGAGGPVLSLEARARSHSPAVRGITMALADRGRPLFDLRAAPGAEAWSVARPALGTEGGRWLPVRHPAAHAAEVFGLVAAARGIVLPGPVLRRDMPADALPLADHHSADLAAMLAGMLRHSTNLTAECLGLTAVGAGGRMPQDLAGSGGAVADWLAGQTGYDRPLLVDHSGLGAASRISAAAMVRGLRRLGPEAGLLPLMRRARLDRGLDPDQRITIRAKTGTLNFVSGLAGWAEAPEGRQIVFAIHAADALRRAALPPDQRDAPPGGRAWAARARRFQGEMIAAWMRA